MDNDTKVQQLTALAKEHAKGNIFVTGEAINAAWAIRSVENWKFRNSALYPEMEAAVKGMWDSYNAVRQMYSLHLEQDFKAYVRSLPWWQRRKARRNEEQYLINREIQLRNEAEILVTSIVDGIDYKELYQR